MITKLQCVIILLVCLIIVFVLNHDNLIKKDNFDNTININAEGAIITQPTTTTVNIPSITAVDTGEPLLNQINFSIQSALQNKATTTDIINQYLSSVDSNISNISQQCSNLINQI